MSSCLKTDRTLDCIGLYCPEPVFQTRLELDKMAVGEILEVVADDPAAGEDIKSLARRTGNEVLKIDKRGNVLRIVVRKANEG